MSRHSFVELATGEQEFFQTPYEAFKYAKSAEEQERNSVALVGVSGEYDAPDEELFFMMDQVTIYRGQRLRHLIRSLDNVQVWIRTQIEEQRHAEEASDDC